MRTDVYHQCTDWQTILRGVNRAEATGTEIDHLTAKVIAAQMHDGSDYALSFASTGAITAPTSTLWRALGGEHHMDQPGHVRRSLDFLGTYIADRVSRGEVGPVVGWHDLAW